MSKFKDVEIGSSFTVNDKVYTKIKRNIRENKVMNAYFEVGESKLGICFADSVTVEVDNG